MCGGMSGNSLERSMTTVPTNKDKMAMGCQGGYYYLVSKSSNNGNSIK
jgi:hypothetical protein